MCIIHIIRLSWIVEQAPKWVQNCLSQGGANNFFFFNWDLELGLKWLFLRLQWFALPAGTKGVNMHVFLSTFPDLGKKRKREWLGFKVFIVKHQNGHNLYCNRYECIYLVTSYWEVLSIHIFYYFCAVFIILKFKKLV